MGFRWENLKKDRDFIKHTFGLKEKKTEIVWLCHEEEEERAANGFHKAQVNLGD